MELLTSQYKDALTRVEIGMVKRGRAIKAHTEIRALLESSTQLKEWGIDTVLIGSYARNTGIYPGKDVDIFAKLTALTVSDITPSEVYEAVAAVLEAEYGERVERQPRSLKIEFPNDKDGFAVDVVPAVRMGDRWGIPRHDTSLWASKNAAERWVETSPEELSRLSEELNKMLVVDSQGAYKPIVKLIRQARKHHLRDLKPGGFYFELLTYWSFTDGDVGGDSWATIYASTLRAIATRLASGESVIDPVLGTPYAPAPDPHAIAQAALVFGDLADKAERALADTKCGAAAAWRRILGENGRGHVFPLPAGCDERGQRVADVRPIVAAGSREPSGFA